MENHDEFLLEEYKESIKKGQWLEENLDKKFKTLSILFIWQVILIGYLIKDQIATKNILLVLYENQSKSIIVIISFVVVCFSFITIDNMAKARIGDVLRTSRINFIRNYFLETLPEKYKKQYFHDKRLKEINNIDIYARQPIKFDSDFFYFTVLSACIGSLSLFIIVASFLSLSLCYYLCITGFCLISSILYAIRKVNKNIPKKERKTDTT